MPTIRRARLSDIPTVARRMIEWRQRWGLEFMDTREGESARLTDELVNWLLDHLEGNETPLYLAVEGDKIIGGCGGTMQHLLLPPYYPYVKEWIWWKDDDCPKQVAFDLWKQVEMWGVVNGARMSLRTTLHATPKGPREVGDWRRI